MPSLVDLHTHSSVSDGSERPEVVVQKAAGAGVRKMALTDHDGTGGLPEAIAASRELDGFQLIPGIELSAEEGIHVLGYFIEYEDAVLQRTLTRLQETREGRAQEIIDRLTALGMPLEFERVKRIADGAIGRPHVARAMLERGYIGSFDEAFERWLGMGKPGYVPSEKLTAQQAIGMIRDAHGVASWAHPEWPDGPQRIRPTEETLRQLLEAGLDGIEVYYYEHTSADAERFLDLARRYELVPTGGSDYHGPEVRAVDLGSVDVPMETMELLQERARRR